jgi:predicted acetyltransferase
MKLVRFDSISESEYVSYIVEWESSGEMIIPGASDRRGRTFNAMTEKWKYDETDETIKNGFVPSTLYFLIDGSSRIYGAIHHRHILNEKLRQHGGHIGYGVRPSERKKGYGSLMLKLLLKILSGLNSGAFLLTCDETNRASQRTIEKNGGVLEAKIEFEGKMTRKYWINT